MAHGSLIFEVSRRVSKIRAVQTEQAASVLKRCSNPSSAAPLTENCESKWKHTSFRNNLT